MGVENPGDFDLQTVLTPIVKEQGFRTALTLIIAGAWANWVDVAPIILGLGVNARITIDFRGGRMKNSCPYTFRESQHVDRAVDACFCRLHGIVLIVNRRGRAGEIVNLIDLQIEREGDIVSDQLEMPMTEQVFDVPSRSGEKIVDTKDDRAVRQETLTQMRTEETSTAGNQYARF